MENVINMIPLTKVQARELGRVLMGLAEITDIFAADFEVAADDSGVRVEVRAFGTTWALYVPADGPMHLHSPDGCRWEYSTTDGWHGPCDTPDFLR